MDFGTAFEQLVNNLIGLSVVILLFTMGLGVTFKQAFLLWQNPKELGKVLLAAMVLVVVVTVALLYLLDNILGLDIPLEVQVSLLLLAGAAGVSSGPEREQATVMTRKSARTQ